RSGVKNRPFGKETFAMSVMAHKSPLARVKDEFGGKDKLVDTIVGLLGSGDEPKDDMRRRLLGAANGKLIRLHGIATEVKDLGGHDKLADAAAAELGRSKDKDYVAKLGTFSSGRLIDLLHSARARNGKNGAAKAKAPASTEASAAAPAAAKPEKKAAAKHAKPTKHADKEKRTKKK